MAGLYIHIPFCESRCIYCGFFSTTSLAKRDAYVDALLGEMRLRPVAAEIGQQERIETIYLGGGTPSQLAGEQLTRLFEGIEHYVLSGERRAESGERRAESEESISKEDENIFEGMEITMECNPDDVTEEFCETLRGLPVNRVSMGAQTFSDDRLRFLRRRHTAAEVRAAVERLRRVGIANISIDLMFGFPGETLEDWQSDLDEAVALGVEHVSAYSLMYEEGTPLHRQLEQGKISEIDEETSRQMYDLLIDRLAAAGYEHYEISNFARPGRRSRHNSSYWHEVPYIGLGAAAHSYKRLRTEGKEDCKNAEERAEEREDCKNAEEREEKNGTDIIAQRSWNASDINQYIASIQRGELPSECEHLDLATRYNDLITTALRTSDGIDIERTRREFGSRIASEMMREAQRHIRLGLMKTRGGRLSLTRRGLYISDDVMSDFMMV